MLLPKQLDSSVIVVTRLWAGQPEFNFWQGQGFFLFATMSGLAVRPTRPPIKWELGAVSLGLKWVWHEAGHSPPYNAEVRDA
jgi:hypothetical protein